MVLKIGESNRRTFLKGPALEERPADTVEASDAERRQLLERSGAQVEAAHLAARGGAGVDDGDGDRLLLVSHLELAAAHRVPVGGIGSAKSTRDDLGREKAYRLGLDPAPGKVWMVWASTATTSSLSVLEMPQDPRPGL